MWRNSVKLDNIELNTTATDHGMCCNVYVKYKEDNKETWPKVGMMNGLKVVAYPGSNEGGVFVALHENKDVPLMNIQGKITRCLKITEKVSFNIVSEASYVYILSGQK